MTRACVIGASLGGLALAIRLQSSGVDTVLVEARGLVGGQAWERDQDGFTFCGGPSGLSERAALEELWQLSGADLGQSIELLEIAPLRRLNWPDGGQLDMAHDAAEMRRAVARFAPSDAAGYEDFQRFCLQAARDGWGDQADSPKRPLSRIARSTPLFLRFQGWRSAWGTVARFVSSEKLREALTVQMLALGGNPITDRAGPVLDHGREQAGGLWWPKGGMQHLAEAMAGLFGKLGGELRLHDPALHVHALGNRVSAVECVSGWQERFDAVASAADLVHTYRDLLSGVARGPNMARQLIRRRFGPGLFATHFGVEGTWPGIPHQTVLFASRFEGAIDDIFTHGVLPRDQLIFLDHPSLTDPSLAPEGKSTFRAVVPVANLAQLPIDWEQTGPLLKQRVLAEVGRRLIPDLDDRLVTAFHVTPRETALDFNAWAGSPFGPRPRLGLLGGGPAATRDAKLINFYLVGGDTRPGDGLHGALAAAKIIARQILEDRREQTS